jgi:hypothetical protein
MCVSKIVPRSRISSAPRLSRSLAWMEMTIVWGRHSDVTVETLKHLFVARASATGGTPSLTSCYAYVYADVNYFCSCRRREARKIRKAREAIGKRGARKARERRWER